MFIRYAAYHLQQLGIKKQKGKELPEIKEKDEVIVKSSKIKEVPVETEIIEKVEIKDKVTKIEKKSKKEAAKKDVVDSPIVNSNDDKSKVLVESEPIVKTTSSDQKEIAINGDVKEELKEKPSDINVVLSENDSVDTDEAKKIVESITDSISNGNKQESEFMIILTNLKNTFESSYYFIICECYF